MRVDGVYDKMANWEVVINGKQGTNDMLNVFHYQSSGVEPPDWDAAATVIRGHLSDHIAPICGSRVTWEGITVREDIAGSVGTFYPFSAGTLTGTQATPDQIDAACMQVRKLTGSLVKPTSGWFMQGGITVQGVGNDNQWGSTVTTAVDDYATDIRILNIAGPSTLTMVIKARNPLAPNTQAYTPVNDFQVVTGVKVQRSRLQGYGS